ncbi:hypothetical protein JCM21142_10 [Saccharicrinis fermentans DSM 9555 = JCM 21142]|uniref:Tetratricopeptide repeat protein n=1 Tax=Saccharicrinis fermentans DSM 9555 = JCM 21142 TaxID=869213 RepID=W7YFL4_9BACT|nr:hypothetical protein JCM21142_10 [Saccharicrinis fermentans DSM 9555 = JCM 21142]
MVSCDAMAQSEKSPFQKTLYDILSLDSIQTDSMLMTLDNRLEKAYLMHYKIFIKQMFDGQWPLDYDRQLELIVDSLEENESKDERAIAFLSEVYIQKGIMEFSVEHQRAAVFSFFKAYRFWRRSKSEYPQLTENIKLAGVFNLLMGNMPQPYRRMAGWIGFSGNDSIGFNALKTNYYANSHKEGSKQEALLYLAYAYLKFDPGEEKIKNLILDSSFEDLLPLTQFIVARCAFKIRKPVLNDAWLRNSERDDFLPLVYLRGKYKVLINDDSGAEDLVLFSRRNTSGQFQADAYRYHSWQLFLEGDTSGYLQLQNSIKDLNYYPTWEDKQARNESGLDVMPHSMLLRSRLLFDAGYYQAAIDSLLTVDFKSISEPGQQVEFQYRLGRCYHLLNQRTTAIFHYTEAIRLGENDTRYFAPYAAVFTAELHKDQNPVTARFFLEEAKRLNNGEYKDAVERKIQLLSEQLETPH